jgi:aspartyl/asparaginyl beta-hydroxylase (cupin superfamily)
MAIVRSGEAEDAQTPQAPRWETEGIQPIEYPNFITQLFMGIVAWAERLNCKYSKLEERRVYDNSSFPWSQELEREWRLIRSELENVLLRKNDLPNMQDIAPDAASITKDPGWKVFLLVAYGVKSKPNIGMCPDTWRIVNKIPGLKTAMFSILEPGKRLPPHRGPYNGVLRLHLGLIVPAAGEDLAMRVGTELYHWQEGRALIFDDAYEHEVWNDTGCARVVLFVDFIKPLKFPACWLNHVLLKLAVFTPYIREAHENLRNWEHAFHRTDNAQ